MAVYSVGSLLTKPYKMMNAADVDKAQRLFNAISDGVTIREAYRGRKIKNEKNKMKKNNSQDLENNNKDFIVVGKPAYIAYTYIAVIWFVILYANLIILLKLNFYILTLSWIFIIYVLSWFYLYSFSVKKSSIKLFYFTRILKSRIEYKNINIIQICIVKGSRAEPSIEITFKHNDTIKKKGINLDSLSQKELFQVVSNIKRLGLKFIDKSAAREFS